MKLLISGLKHDSMTKNFAMSPEEDDISTDSLTILTFPAVPITVSLDEWIENTSDDSPQIPVMTCKADQENRDSSLQQQPCCFRFVPESQTHLGSSHSMNCDESHSKPPGPFSH